MIKSLEELRKRSKEVSRCDCPKCIDLLAIELDIWIDDLPEKTEVKPLPKLKSKSLMEF